MNKAEFVNSFKIVVGDRTATGVVEALRGPLGRQADLQLNRLSDWYVGLSASDRDHIVKIIEMTAKQSAYNALLIFDGLLSIESRQDKGELEIVYRRGALQTHLNDSDSEPLTALFKELR